MAGDDAVRVARTALEEDGERDITSDVCIPAGARGEARIEFRTGGVVAGTAFADAVMIEAGLDPVRWLARDGDVVGAGAVIGEVDGDLALLLRAERPMLNLLQRATGIATATRAYVDAVSGTKCRVLHTRKTTPGLRGLDIAAVLAGGGALHRTDLATTVMVKDNHWTELRASSRKLREALDAARRLGASALFVEVESLEQLDEACAAGATRLLVDNQTPETVRAWGTQARTLRSGIEIEATGGITLANVREYAEAGADFVSIGALTHSVVAGDVALEVRSEK
ncbi:MAG TPA: carboxylating nicotinate-nucleotide diphosphorylase [Gemmatimonadales bacterium]|nr:carboxylating nicotinate-nucleotide diphosphorylase [Gemmatimonadales bacterium]